MKKLSELLDLAQHLGSKRVVVADAAENEVLAAIEDARKAGIVSGILVGKRDKIAAIAEPLGIDLANYELVEEPNPKKTASVAVKLLKSGQADVLMKGLVGTADFLKAILSKEDGLLDHSKKKLLSHVAVFEVPVYHKLLIVTDAAINIAPTLDEKVEIIRNTVPLAHSIGIEKPKIACIAAVEKVNPGKMPATEDAAILSMMNRRGQIEGCIVDGPFGFDNAIDIEAARIKSVEASVAGDADIILCPTIESANVLYKALQFFANAPCAALVAGTPVPIVLTSRADSHQTKLASLTLGVVSAHKK